MISFDSFIIRDDIPIYLQILRHVKRGIVSGAVKNGDELPSRRVLSALLGVNPNTIQKAFGELDRGGIIVMGQGRGCFVADRAAEKIREKLSAKIGEIESIAAELARAGIEKEKLTEAIGRAYAATENRLEQS